jgi:hypothetical protein
MTSRRIAMSERRGRWFSSRNRCGRKREKALTEAER